MIDEILLRKKLEAGLVPSQNSLELKERILMSKWVSLSSLSLQNSDDVSEYMKKRKENLVQYYSKYLHVAKSLESKIDARQMREEQMHGDSSDELGFFLGGFCSKISFWSRLMRHMCCANQDLAAKESLAEIRKTAPLDEETADMMLVDTKSVLYGEGTIIGPLDAMLSCRNVLLPVLEQSNFSISKIEGEADLHTSEKLTLLPQLKKMAHILPDDDKIILQRRHSDHSRILRT